MNASHELALMNSICVLPFKHNGTWTVIFNNLAKTFGNVSDAMCYAKGLVK